MFPQNYYSTAFDDVVKNLVKEINNNHKLKQKNNSASSFSKIIKEEGKFIYRASAPGFKDLDIQLENNKVKIKSTEENVLGLKFYDWFTFDTSDNVEVDSITSTLKDGILEIVLPITEKNKPRKINVTR